MLRGVDAGFINAFGRCNVGIQAYLRGYHPRTHDQRTIISLGGFSAAEFNVSCHNVNIGLRVVAELRDAGVTLPVSRALRAPRSVGCCVPSSASLVRRRRCRATLSPPHCADEGCDCCDCPEAMRVAVIGVTERTRARRPKAVLVDVFETMLQLEALRPRFVDVGRPEHELELFFARTLRDGMALTLAGGAPPFAEVARSALITTTGRTLSEEAVRYVLAGFEELPPHPDVEPALMMLAGAGVAAYAFTHGSAEVACAALDKAQLRSYLRGVLSTQQLESFKPPATVYHWGCRQVNATPATTALIAVHSWDVHGAVRAGLLGGFATRHEGGMSDVVDVPHVVAGTLDEVVERLLNLPS